MKLSIPVLTLRITLFYNTVCKQTKTTCTPHLRLATPPNIRPSEAFSHSYAPRPINLVTVLRCHICKGECLYLLDLPFLAA